MPPLPDRLRYLTLLSMSLGLGAQAYAQSSDLAYSGPYSTAGYRGAADFGFDLAEDGDTLLDGRFRMRGADLEALVSPEGDTYFAFDGQFDDGVPVERWSFVFGDHTATGEVELDDYQYRVNVDGVQHEASGMLAAGQPQGPWVHEVQRIRESRAVGPLFRSELTFDEGVAQQSFRLDGPDETLLGRFGRDGLAEDTWTLYADAVETARWHFRRGRLVRVELVGDEAGGSLPVFDLPAGAPTTTVGVDARYFRILDAWQLAAGREGALSESPAAELLIRNADNYAQLAGVFAELGYRDFAPRLLAEVPTYPLTPAEREGLVELSADLAAADSISAYLLADRSLAVLENADDDTRDLRERLRALGDELAPARSLAEAYRGDVLEFVPRDRLYAQLSGETSTGELSAVLAKAERALAGVDSVEGRLNRKLATKERRQVLTALEGQLDVEYRDLDSLIDAQDRRLVKEYELKALREARREDLRTYSALANPRAKRARVRELIDCMGDTRALVVSLARLPARWDEIREAYTNEVWNNFTLTVMEERVKKHLLEAYEEDLVPYFRERVRATPDCATTAALVREMDVAHERLLALREADTDALEDRLKQTDDPARILDLLSATVQQ